MIRYLRLAIAATPQRSTHRNRDPAQPGARNPRTCQYFHHIALHQGPGLRSTIEAVAVPTAPSRPTKLI